MPNILQQFAPGETGGMPNNMSMPQQILQAVAAENKKKDGNVMNDYVKKLLEIAQGSGATDEEIKARAGNLASVPQFQVPNASQIQGAPQTPEQGLYDIMSQSMSMPSGLETTPQIGVKPYQLQQPRAQTTMDAMRMQNTGQAAQSSAINQARTNVMTDDRLKQIKAQDMLSKMQTERARLDTKDTNEANTTATFMTGAIDKFAKGNTSVAGLMHEEYAKHVTEHGEPKNRREALRILPDLQKKAAARYTPGGRSEQGVGESDAKFNSRMSRQDSANARVGAQREATALRSEADAARTAVRDRAETRKAAEFEFRTMGGEKAVNTARDKLLVVSEAQNDLNSVVTAVKTLEQTGKFKDWNLFEGKWEELEQKWRQDPEIYSALLRIRQFKVDTAAIKSRQRDATPSQLQVMWQMQVIPGFQNGPSAILDYAKRSQNLLNQSRDTWLKVFELAHLEKPETIEEGESPTVKSTTPRMQPKPTWKKVN